jgi:hypothetical protein
MIITTTDLGRMHRRALDAVQHRQEIVEVTRYGQIVARLVPATAVVTLDESAVAAGNPPEIAGTLVKPGENGA